jgi:anti-sigma regulatory factor (Ser/Thr protein kinase)
MMISRLTLTNRQENLKLLVDFIQKWGQDRGLSASRRADLAQATGAIFRHLVTQAYRPDQPGSIAIILEEKGPRLRLIFEDDAPPHDPTSLIRPAVQGPEPPGGASHLSRVHQLAESLIYYRTPDSKNRLVVFLNF